MKNFTSLKFLLSALMLCLVIGAQAGVVTFNGENDTNGKTEAGADHLTKNGVTMSVSRGFLASSNGQYRTYTGETMAISSTVGTITKIVFTCTAKDDAQYGPGCFTAAPGNYFYEGNTGTWIGAANEVVFTAGNYQVRATEILVTVDGDVPVDPDPGPGPDPTPTDVYTSIAAMKAAATADKTDATYQFKDLLVTYVSGAYNFVSDGTDGLLFYGTTELAAGDKITGFVTGKLYQYNGLTEMTENSFSIDSKTSGNAVTPQNVAVASILSDYRNYESEYVRISDVTFNGAFANGVTVSQNGSDMVLYNRFNLNYEVNTDHKYDIYGFPAIFKETIQLYVTEIVDQDGDNPGLGPGSEPTSVYTSIAAMKAAATADKTDAAYQFKDLLVTYVGGVNNHYTFVSDGTDGFLFYGASDLVAGDKITGFVTGKLYQYNGLTEMSDNTFTIESKTSGNEVTAQDVEVASILSDYRNYESEYVKISGVTFNGDFANGVTVSQNGYDLTIYNRFNLSYDVNNDHKYDIYGFPTIYKETVLLYVTEIVDKGDADYHRLILTVNEGGTIIYNGKTIKNSSATFDIVEGNTATITVEPYEKYKLISLKMNGINVKKYMEGNTFTTDEIDGDVEIVATFDLIDPYITITPTNKLQTFCSDENLNFSEVNGLTAYIVVGYKPSAKELLLTPVIEVPAGTGVLLKGEVEKTYKVPTLDASDYNYSNALVGVLEDEEVRTGFVFDETFKAVDGSAVVPANTAYLLLPAATDAGISELKGYLTDGPAVKGDLNGDGMADISDVVYLVNLILGQ